MSKVNLFSRIKIRGITFENRIWVSPMSMYNAEEGTILSRTKNKKYSDKKLETGFVNDFHLVNYGMKCFGAGAITVEGTSISEEGRITIGDLGIYRDEHIEGHKRIVDFVRKNSTAKVGVELSHAGRKASTFKPYGERQSIIPLDEGGWTQLSPSESPFVPSWRKPKVLTEEKIKDIIHDEWVGCVRRCKAAGYDYILLHAGFGFLIHQFLSPLSNCRTDKYGGSLHKRHTFLLELVEAIRKEWEKPLFVRIASEDGAEGGSGVEDAVMLCESLQKSGVDLVDVSGGGIVPNSFNFTASMDELSHKMKKALPQFPMSVCGGITTPEKVNEIVSEGKADAAVIARQFLRDPLFALNAAKKYNQFVEWPIEWGYALDPVHHKPTSEKKKLKEELRNKFGESKH